MSFRDCRIKCDNDILDLSGSPMIFFIFFQENGLFSSFFLLIIGMKKNIFYLTFLLAFAVLSGGCLIILGSSIILGCSIDNKLDGYEKISVSLPAWPPFEEAIQSQAETWPCQSTYPELAKWIIRIRGEELDKKMEVFVDGLGSSESNTVGLNENTCDISTTPFSISLKVAKNKPLSITATPITLNKNNQPVEFFKCAGAIYPQNYEVVKNKGKFWQGNKGNVQMSWENGFSAQLMQTLYDSAAQSSYDEQMIQDFIAGFNWKKLQQYIQAQIDSFEENMQAEMNIQTNANTQATSLPLFYNPWLLDMQTVLEKIAMQGFTATALNLKNSFQISLKDKIDCERSELIAVMSSFVPENQIIQKYGTISLAKDKASLFSLDNLYGAIFTGTSAKNVSIEYVFLPIFINDEK